MKKTDLIAEITENLLAAFIQTDELAKNSIAKLEGKVLSFNITDLNQIYYLLIYSSGHPPSDSTGIQIETLYEGHCHTCLKGSSVDFLFMLLNNQDNAALLTGKIQVTGDTTLLTQFYESIQLLSIDWEIILAEYSGDIFAHSASQISKNITSWVKNTTQTLEQDIAEYWLEEKEVLTHSFEVNHFNRAVDDTRSAVDRLAARIQRMEAKLTDKTEPQ